MPLFFSGAVRWLLPLLAGLLLWRLGRGLLFFRGMREIWAWIILPDGKRLPVTHWENTLGSAPSCDIRVTGEKVARVHAVLTRDDNGTWIVADADSRQGIKVAGKKTGRAVVKYGQAITLGDVRVTLEPITPQQEQAQAEYRTREGKAPGAVLTLLILSLFQAVLTVALLAGVEARSAVLAAMCGLFAMEWLLFVFYRLIRRRGFEIETGAFFLCSLGLAVIASSAPEELGRQTLCIALGLVLFLSVGWCLRDLKRARTVRYFAAAVGLCLLLATMLFGTEVNGAKNWIFLGSTSVQPSELAKVCFVFVGASTLERLVTRRNLLLFLVYTGAVCACLAVLSDFGTALVFFTVFVVVAFLRSGDLAALGLICGGTGFAGFLAVRFLPYIRNRFAAWRHVWEFAQTGGYQQTRAMMCIAAGGLFGLGAGEGWFKYVGAADTDLVFALVAEEYGLLLAVFAVLAVVLLVLFAVRSVPLCRSSFYAIAACAAACVLATQTVLNVFGTVDLLPLTGVTFPFLSNGGTGIIAAWGLLAFLKSADTRQNASFTIRLPGRDEK